LLEKLSNTGGHAQSRCADFFIAQDVVFTQAENTLPVVFRVFRQKRPFFTPFRKRGLCQLRFKAKNAVSGKRADLPESGPTGCGRVKMLLTGGLLCEMMAERSLRFFPPHSLPLLKEAGCPFLLNFFVRLKSCVVPNAATFPLTRWKFAAVAKRISPNI
jgi:hypothetical protein